MKPNRVLVKNEPESPLFKAAASTLVFIGYYKGNGVLFSDNGNTAAWQAHQRELAKQGLPASGK